MVMRSRSMAFSVVGKPHYFSPSFVILLSFPSAKAGEYSSSVFLADPGLINEMTDNMQPLPIPTQHPVSTAQTSHKA